MKGVTIMALEEKLNQAKGALKENVGKLIKNKLVFIQQPHKENLIKRQQKTSKSFDLLVFYCY